MFTVWCFCFICRIKIKCGKGFYVRSLARDLAEELSTKGHIFSLKRTKVGRFAINNSILLDDLLKIGEMTSAIKGFHSSISMLDDILAFEIDNNDDIENLSLGKSINIDENKLRNFSSEVFDKKQVFISNNGDIVSIGKLIGNLFKPKKVLI